MNRTDRLYALREELRRAGSTGRTAARLAHQFEVSVRTIKRDISTLQYGGFPVWARSGPSGGYVVDASATLPPVNITVAEASALATALAVAQGQPFASHGTAALAKLLSVMDERARAQAKRLSNRIWINDTTESIGSAVLSPVEQALQEGRVLNLVYSDANAQVTSRQVDPQLLARLAGHWHLVAYCRLRQQIRWFRLDRIQQATLTTQTASDIPLADIGEPPPSARPVMSPR
ncbi:MAG: YafY family transcriptional regulator [Propionibacteriaceae bacterium]|nr:YafY family transcriptional regulator [Propionibacteriaceae bacterium]